ncbi:glycosyltransferase family 4 protein [Methylomonas sp. OY6]|uniref:Glycosyltransferase family 4 protein n=1 Tax=Methylomonas defluvii TaxID=3045149 RepID=A0ABU4UCJ7_9GAMM|nr:glycosyltransferase family 4 protein [Methylomonas sp. OY6]MDX8127146.1 glycosyltransferase family 4 protein [Methylomonas sp. OY6]
MNSKCKLVVVTMMTPHGETGVQTHFNAILNEAAKRGVEAYLVHPYSEDVLVARKIAGAIAKLFRVLNKEWMILWNRWTHYLLITHLLKRQLKQCPGEIVMYAQDTLSCRAALASKGPGHKVVTVVHFNISEAHEALTKGQTIEGGPLYNHLQKSERESLPYVDKILFVSNFMQTEVKLRLPLVNSIPKVVIANFIQDQSSVKHKSELQGDLITIGTLEKRKNQIFILKVLANAHARGHKYKLTIIGDGPDRIMLQNKVLELNLEDSVTFLGFQSNASKYMPGHRLYVHSAIMENLSITLIEALSNSLPIIAPAVGGIPEIFSEGEQGYFWPLDDEEEATNILCSVLENKSDYAKFAAQARVKFVESFSENILASRWIDELTNT